MALAIALSLFLFFSDRVWLEGFALAHIISATAIIACLMVLVRAMLHRRPSSLIVFGGGIILSICGANELLRSMRIIDTVPLMKVGLLVLIGSQSCALALRFSKSFATTERLSAELQENNIALSKLDKLKDEFLANTSHELRTPLSGIIGIAESMLVGAVGQLSVSAQNNLSMVVASGRRLTALINDLLDFSRLKNKDLALNYTAVDLRALTDTVLTVMAPMAEAKGLVLGHTLPQDLPPALGDENRLQQIFYNLIGNAVKFTEQGRVTVTATAMDQTIEVAVTDTGIGIPSEKLDNIFISFEQVDTTATRQFGGTGLGLSITKDLVELHGGQIRLVSTLGSGSTFIFTLPTADADVKPAATRLNRIVNAPEYLAGSKIVPDGVCKAPQTNGALSGYTVLVVDDDPINLQVAANHLVTAGHGVRTATCGTAALKIINSEQTPDLVLLDIMMPGMSGYEVCRKLRDRHTSSILPVIMLSARNRISDLVEGFDTGGNDYLTKPFSRQELLSRVNAQLQLKKAFHTLSENVGLKKELARRRETEQHLLLMQRRLSRLLDTVDDAIIAVNENEEITFSNRVCADLLGSTPAKLLGRPVRSIFGAESIENLPLTAQNNPSLSVHTPLQNMILQRVDETPFTADLLITRMEVEDEQFTVFIIRTVDQLGNANSATPVALSSLMLITELNRNQKRIRALEETLYATQPHMDDVSPSCGEIDAIDNGLTTVNPSPCYPEKQTGRKQLAVSVMNLCIDYWIESTSMEKFDLARHSSLWKVYTNMDGWERTQTLDKYLSVDALPQNPRWKKVFATADFVLSFTDTHSVLREDLESALTQLRQACR